MFALQKSPQTHRLPFPTNWRSYFKDNNLKVSGLSFFCFIVHVVQTAYRAMKTWLRLLFKYNQKIVQNSIAINSSSVKINANSKLENFYNWARKKYNAEYCYFFPYTLAIDEKNFPALYPFPAIVDPFKKLCFFCISSYYIFLSFVSLLLGKWHLLYLIEDIILYQYAVLVEKQHVPKTIIFTVENCIYKPLWAYSLEKKSKIILVFYSFNDGFYLKKNGVVVGPAPEYKKMTWKNLHVSNDTQKNQLLATLSLNPSFNKKNVSITVEDGFIPFHDSNHDLSYLDKTKNIAFFPVSLYSQKHLAEVGFTDSLYTFEIMETILIELSKWAKKNNYKIILKDKHYPKGFMSKEYQKLSDDLIKENFIETVSDSAISPAKLIAKCEAVICQPFTTPSIVAQSMNKPVCYADPSILLLKNQPASNGIEIVQGKGSLCKWLDKKLLNTKGSL